MAIVVVLEQSASRAQPGERRPSGGHGRMADPRLRIGEFSWQISRIGSPAADRCGARPTSGRAPLFSSGLFQQNLCLALKLKPRVLMRPIAGMRCHALHKVEDAFGWPAFFL